MTEFRGYGTRAAWRWCCLYTAVAPTAQRERRRQELRSHLYESDYAVLEQAAVFRAAVNGVASDIGWALAWRCRKLPSGLASPMTYVVLSALAVLGGAFSDSALGDPAWIGRIQLGGLLLSVALLAVAAGVAYMRRRHRP